MTQAYHKNVSNHEFYFGIILQGSAFKSCPNHKNVFDHDLFIHLIIDYLI